MIRVIAWVTGIVIFMFLMYLARDAEVQRCEVDTARKLNAEAHYVNGKCMVKGWGRFN